MAGAHLSGLVLTVLGLPGSFLQVGATALFAWATGGAEIGPRTVALFLGLALCLEVFEFFAGKWGAKRFGGSSKASWGALSGGFVGALLGLPVPVPLVGSLLGSLLGTFVGAVLGEYLHQRRTKEATRAGCGALLGRAAALAVKIAGGLLMLAVTVFLLLSARW